MRRNFEVLPALALSLVAVGCARNDAPTSTALLPLAPGNEGTLSAQIKGGRPGSTAAIYVTSQGLYYDTFLARDPLPMHGPFQLLVNARAEFGPGDPGYRGGRWWEDTNHNGIQDPDDHFFLAPLLPPGRPGPLP
jgi:hypothetical protein